MNNAKPNEDFTTNSPESVLKALANLKELAGSQDVGAHLREMYLAWLGSEFLANVEPSARSNFYESYESINLLLKELGAGTK